LYNVPDKVTIINFRFNYIFPLRGELRGRGVVLLPVWLISQC
jgi:hypothetical protein